MAEITGELCPHELLSILPKLDAAQTTTQRTQHREFLKLDLDDGVEVSRKQVLMEFRSLRCTVESLSWVDPANDKLTTLFRIRAIGGIRTIQTRLQTERV